MELLFIMHPFDILNLDNGARLIFTPCPGTREASLQDSLKTLQAAPQNNPAISARLNKAQAQWTFSQAGFRLSDDARYVPTLITTTSETLLQQMEGLTLAYTQLLGSPPATPAAPSAN